MPRRPCVVGKYEEGRLKVMELLELLKELQEKLDSYQHTELIKSDPLKRFKTELMAHAWSYASEAMQGNYSSRGWDRSLFKGMLDYLLTHDNMFGEEVTNPHENRLKQVLELYRSHGEVSDFYYQRRKADQD